MDSRPPKAKIDFLYSLIPGEWAEVFDDESNVLQWTGVVQETAPEIGVAWIRTDVGERKLLDVHEHSARRVASNQVGAFNSHEFQTCRSP